MNEKNRGSGVGESILRAMRASRIVVSWRRRMTSIKRSQNLASSFVGDVATPNKSPDRLLFAEAYHAESGAGAMPKASISRVMAISDVASGSRSRTVKPAGAKVRVLKPGGRVAISDVVNIAPLPEDLRADPKSLCGCVAAAISAARRETLPSDAGFSYATGT